MVFNLKNTDTSPSPFGQAYIKDSISIIPSNLVRWTNTIIRPRIWDPQTQWIKVCVDEERRSQVRPEVVRFKVAVFESSNRCEAGCVWSDLSTVLMIVDDYDKFCLAVAALVYSTVEKETRASSRRQLSDTWSG